MWPFQSSQHLRPSPLFVIHVAASPPESICGLCAGVGGGSASGKTTVATKIIDALSVQWVVLLSMDSFYKVAHCTARRSMKSLFVWFWQVLNEEEQKRAARGDYDFDCPGGT